MFKVVTYWGGEPDLLNVKSFEFEEEAIKFIDDRVDKLIKQYEMVGATELLCSHPNIRKVLLAGERVSTLVVYNEDNLVDLALILSPEVLRHYEDYLADLNNDVLGSVEYMPIGVHTLIITICPGVYHIHLRNHPDWYIINNNKQNAIGLWVEKYGLHLENLQRTEEPEFFK